MENNQFKAIKKGFYTMEHNGGLKEALETLKPLKKEIFFKLIETEIYEFYAYDDRIKANRYILKDLEHNYGLPCWLIEASQETTKHKSKNAFISICLNWKDWEAIANACISVAEHNLINDDIKEDLRKTYFTIKAMTR